MQYKNRFIAVVLFSALFSAVAAQSPLVLSSPLGLQRPGGCTPSLALGGAGTGIGNDLLGLTANPANLGTSNRTTFSTAVAGDFLFLSDGDSSSQHMDMNLRVISLSVPLGTFGAIGFAVEPYSSTNIQFRAFKDYSNYIKGDSAERGLRQTGGAINWQFGWGYTLMKKARIGLAVKRMNFNETHVEIKRTHGTLNDRFIDSTRIHFTTNGIHAGIQVPFSKFTVGLSGDYYLITTAKRKWEKYGTQDSTVIRNSDDFEIKPPPSLTIGASWEPGAQWLLAADVGATFWDMFFTQYNKPSSLRENAITVSGGAQFIPAPNLLTPKFYEIIQYRCGMRYSQLPGLDSYEAAATLSAGLPMQSSGGLFDIIFEYIRRKNTRFDNYTENIFSIKLGVNGGRKWGQSSDGSY